MPTDPLADDFDLRAWMDGGDWSVRSLAVALRVSPSTVQKWADGTHETAYITRLALVALEMGR